MKKAFLLLAAVSATSLMAEPSTAPAGLDPLVDASVNAGPQGANTGTNVSPAYAGAEAGERGTGAGWRGIGAAADVNGVAGAAVGVGKNDVGVEVDVPVAGSIGVGIGGN